MDPARKASRDLHVDTLTRAVQSLGENARAQDIIAAALTLAISAAQQIGLKRAVFTEIVRKSWDHIADN